MAVSFSLFLTLTLTFSLIFNQATSQPALNSAEQESLYLVLNSINSEIPWRSLFPDDLCASAPHGVVCDVFSDESNGSESTHVTELSFGYVSDYSPNPPCTPDSTITTPLLSPFNHLRKLFFYKCFFSSKNVPLPNLSALTSSLEEVIFIENPSLVGSLEGKMGNLTSLRRLVFTGTNVSGEIPDGLSDLTGLEQITLSRNRFSGEVKGDFSRLKKLKVLDLSQNGLEGDLPDSIGGLTEVLKVDLSWNNFSGKIPDGLKNLKNLEFLDLGYNSFGKFGIPSFLGEMTSLREVHLSGNNLGGAIPEIWENLGGIMGIGLSGTGLVGNIPASMGVHLRNLCYIGLDNNGLEGNVPEEFGSLESLSEINLMNNKLRGKLPFSAEFAAKIGEKLKLEGNPGLCVDEGLRYAKTIGSLRQLKLCKNVSYLGSSSHALFVGGNSVQQASHLLMFIGFLFLVA